MNRFICNSSIARVIEYFREKEYSKPEQIGLFFYFKAAGLTADAYSVYKKWGDCTDGEKKTYLRALYDLAGVFDASSESAQKYSALFPFSITHSYKAGCFYNGGSHFKTLCSRINDTLDNSLVSTIIQRSDKKKECLKLSKDCLSILTDKMLKGSRIPLQAFALWCYKFWTIEQEPGVSNKDLQDAVVLNFLLNYHITEEEYTKLFYFDNLEFEWQENRITGDDFRELLAFNNPECKPEVTPTPISDSMDMSMILTSQGISNLLALRGEVLTEERIKEILRDQDAKRKLEPHCVDDEEEASSGSIDYAWYVGASFSKEDGSREDYTEQFINEGRWMNGYDLKYTEVVKTIKIGDRIVIKSTYTKKYDLPFNAHGETISVMAIKAIGIVTENLMDGKNIKVAWTRVEPIKEWYGDGVLRKTVHLVRASDGYIKKALLRFTFDNMSQDYSIFEDEDDSDKEHPTMGTIRTQRVNKDFPLNQIMYGAPGTGKTYATTEYAMAIVENRPLYVAQRTLEQRAALLAAYQQCVEKGRIVFTTFHQSYGYEDFIQGLRPDAESEGFKFKPVDGVFKRIADTAMSDPANNYVIIIDEINRANISKVFGELITLIEEDKRWGEANQLSVVLPSGELFAVPNNLYIVGTMNSADKSISLIDAALRRRFEFVEIVPNAELVTDAILRTVLIRLNESLVAELESTDLLIGHAYFIGKTESDLCGIMNRAIIPLLYEYFYDNAKKVKDLVKKAIDGFTYDIEDCKIGRIKIFKKGE